MTAFFPPSSVMTRLMWSCPAGTSAPCFSSCSPTAREPVKAIIATSLWLARTGPTTSPTPGRKLTTPPAPPAHTGQKFAPARRPPRLLHALHELRRHDRALLGRLHHDRVAGHDRGRR